MPQVGPLEILIVAVIALVVFGPEKLPSMARNVGKGLSQLRSLAEQVKADFDLGMDEPADETPGEDDGRPHPDARSVATDGPSERVAS